jgi:single-stranded DNA-binding protein
MPTLASCTVVGHLYRKPEHFGQGEQAAAKFSFYTTDRVKNDKGEWEKEFTSHSAILYGKEAEWLIRDGEKGKLVAVTGTFRIRTWKKNDGATSAGIDIRASSARILDRDDSADDRVNPASAPARSKPLAPVSPAAGGGGSQLTDEPPFRQFGIETWA